MSYSSFTKWPNSELQRRTKPVDFFDLLSTSQNLFSSSQNLFSSSRRRVSLQFSFTATDLVKSAANVSLSLEDKTGTRWKFHSEGGKTILPGWKRHLEVSSIILILDHRSDRVVILQRYSHYFQPHYDQILKRNVMLTQTTKNREKVIQRYCPFCPESFHLASNFLEAECINHEAPLIAHCF